MSEPSKIDRNRAKRTGLKVAAATFLAMSVVAVILLCWLLGIRSGKDLNAYRALARGDLHPIWRDLALRRVRKGDDLAATVRSHPPVSREDFGPYAVLTYNEKGSSGALLRIVAANGLLIEARAGGRAWEHIFFESPSQEQAFNQAYSEYTSQQLLETKACQIHRAITAGQDVFISRGIARRDVVDSNDPAYDPEMMRQLEQVYGPDYVRQMLGGNLELTVEISKVLSGDLKPGTTLKFSGKECDNADLAEPEPVFLHFKDSRTIRPNSEGRELYLTVPGKALAWYLSLTADQIKDFEARCLAREAKPQN